jgi:hypothetical protein
MQFAMAFIQFVSVLVAVILIPVFIGLIVGAMNEQKDLAVSSSQASKKENKNV